MRRNPCEYYKAGLVEDDITNVHFTFKGPADSEFARGYYHGKIDFPSTYPLTPPSVKIMTTNGRFETNKEICLNVSQRHPDQWQAAFTIHLIILSLMIHMTTREEGADGALNCTPEERRRLAEESVLHVYTCVLSAQFMFLIIT
jgi:ubiquitin-conjugating enzyme E2 J1